MAQNTHRIVVPNEKFKGQNTITHVSFGEECVGVGDRSFENCSELSEINDDNEIETIGSYAFTHTSLIYAKFPKVKTIGNNAFEGCIKLENIRINNDCTSIGDGAFAFCEKLTDVTIPTNENFKTINNETFFTCASLSKIIIPNNVKTIGSGAFTQCGNLTDVTIGSNVETIGNDAFILCSTLPKISIPDSVKTIGGGAFKYCYSITSVKIGKNVTSIGADAFSECSSLTDVELNCETVGSWFSKNGTIKRVGIGDYVKTIGNDAFTQCSNLTTATIGKNVTSIGERAFSECSSLTDVTYITNGSVTNCSITNIGENAFEKCSNFTWVQIPDSVETIGDGAFNNCTNLSGIYVGKNVSIIGAGAFSVCSNMRDIYINDLSSWCNIKFSNEKSNPLSINNEIESSLHLNDNSTNDNEENIITTLEIPKDIKTISRYAFYNYKKIGSVIIHKDIEGINDLAFFGCNNLKKVLNYSGLDIKEKETTYGYVAYYADKVISASANCEDFVFEIINGKNTLVDYLGTKKTQIVFPTSTNIIFSDGKIYDNYIVENGELNNENPEFSGVFACHNEIKDLYIFDGSATNIGEYTFYKCEELELIELCGEIESIKNNAFKGCSKLSKITIEYSLNPLKFGYNEYKQNGSGENLFYDCGITELYLNRNISADDEKTGFHKEYGYSPFSEYNKKDKDGKKYNTLKKVEIGNNVTEICDYAFYYCTALENVTIGNSVEEIGDCAFYHCDMIERITIPEGVEEIGVDAFKLEKPNELVNGKKERVVNITNLESWFNIIFENVYSNPLYRRNLYVNDINTTTISITGRLEEIKDFALSGCKNLTDIIIENGVKTIGKYAFCDMGTTSNNISITIPESVEEIGEYAFAEFYDDSFNNYNRNIGKVYVNNVNGVSAWCNIDFKNEYSNPAAVPNGFCLSGTDDLINKLIIPEDVKKIGNYAFNYFTHVESITILKNVNTIGKYAFSFCGNGINYFIKRIVIGNNVRNIGEGSFVELDIKDNIIIIGKQSPKLCSEIFSDRINAKPKIVINLSEQDYFDGEDSNIYPSTPSNYYHIKKSTIIDDYFVFGEDKSLLYCYMGYDREIFLPTIGKNYNINMYAFYNCDMIESVTIPDSVTSIGDEAFHGCTSLKQIVIGKNVQNINKSCFKNCSDIKRIIIGREANANTIGDKAFYFDKIDTNKRNHIVFNFSKNTSLNITAGETGNGYVAHDAIGVVTYRKDYTIENDYILGDPDNIILTYIGNNNKLILPDKQEIGSYAFYECLCDIDDITIGSSTKKINECAFYGCKNIKNIVIPNKITEINKRAFYNCSGLEIIIIGSGVTSIGEEAFFGCENLTTVVNLSAHLTIERNDNNGYVGKNAEEIINVNEGGEQTKKYIFVTLNDINILCYYNYNDEKTIELPENYNGKNYVIGESLFSGCTNLETLIIPDSVTSIGNNAFADCTSLTNVIIGSGVTNIGDNAFIGCESLTRVEIPDNVTNIGNNAFEDCKSLIYVKIGNDVTSIGNSAFYGCENLTTVEIPDINSVTNIGNNAFCNTGIINIEIPDKVTSIGDYAFYGCTNLESVEIPDNVKSIGDNTFEECTSLTKATIGKNVISIGHSAFHNTGISSIEIPDSVTSIGDYAFGECDSLTKAIIGKNVTSIGDYAFCNTGIGDIEIPDKVTSIGKYTFFNSRISAIEIPDSVTSIGDYSFGECAFLADVTIGNSVTSIGEYTFGKCISLADVTIGNSVTSIGHSAFNGCKKLNNVKIPDSVTSIGDNVFKDCTTLKSIKIQDSVTSIGEYAFYGCASLTDVTIGNSVTSIGKYTFFNTGISDIKIPDSVTSIGYKAFASCSSLIYIIIGNGVTNIGDNVFDGCGDLKSVVIGSGVTSDGFGSNVFKGCTTLGTNNEGVIVNLSELSTNTIKYGNAKVYNLSGKMLLNDFIFYTNEDRHYLHSHLWHYFYDYNITNELVLPENYKGNEYIIDKEAFYCYDTITSVTIPDKVIAIFGSAFENCTSLTKATIGNGVKLIGECAFDDCENLKDVTIGNSVISINFEAFAGCVNLTSINIPDSVKNIGDNAFSYCTSLTDVTIGSGIEQIGYYVFQSCENLTSVTLRSVKPPVIDKDIFEDVIIENLKIYVPSGSLNEYKENVYWKQYKDYIYGQ